MTKGNFIFSQISNENGQDKMAMYFDVDGDVVEVKMGNTDYIENKLSEFGVKDLESLDEHLTKNPEQEVYEYDYTDKKGKRHNGFTLDKPFPTPSEAKKAIVAGKVKEVVDNGSKIAVIVDAVKEGGVNIVLTFILGGDALGDVLADFLIAGGIHSVGSHRAYVQVIFPVLSEILILGGIDILRRGFLIFFGIRSAGLAAAAACGKAQAHDNCQDKAHYAAKKLGVLHFILLNYIVFRVYCTIKPTALSLKLS